jgi:membrane-associated phospholipid phosphatase
MSLIWGFRLVTLLMGGDGPESEERSFERFSFLGPSFQADSSPEVQASLPIWMSEDDAGFGFLTEAKPDGACPWAGRAGAGLLHPPPDGEVRAVLWESGQEKAEKPNPPRDEPHFDPPHLSWDGVGNHFSSKAWKDYVWDDYLATPEILLPLGFAVSAAAISHWDRTLERHWNGLLGSHRSYSDLGQYALIGAVALDGILLPGEGRNWWDEVWTIGEAYGASSLTVYVLKTSVQRPRPGGGHGIGTHSFPSGHSNSAFTAATLIERNSGPMFGVPAYGLAAFTAFERVEEGHHYPSDILASAAIGTLSANIFDSLHWGAGNGAGGIARPTAEAKFGFLDGLHGFTLELSIGF